MGYRCMVTGCRSGLDTERRKLKQKGKRQTAMFKLRKEMVDRWKTKLGLKDIPLSPRHYICELHFDEEDVVIDNERPGHNGSIMTVPKLRAFLKPNSIPHRQHRPRKDRRTLPLEKIFLNVDKEETTPVGQVRSKFTPKRKAKKSVDPVGSAQSEPAVVLKRLKVENIRDPIGDDPIDDDLIDDDEPMEPSNIKSKVGGKVGSVALEHCYTSPNKKAADDRVREGAKSASDIAAKIAAEIAAIAAAKSLCGPRTAKSVLLPPSWGCFVNDATDEVKFCHLSAKNVVDKMVAIRGRATEIYFNNAPVTGRLRPRFSEYFRGPTWDKLALQELLLRVDELGVCSGGRAPEERSKDCAQFVPDKGVLGFANPDVMCGACKHHKSRENHLQQRKEARAVEREIREAVKVPRIRMVQQQNRRLLARVHILEERLKRKLRFASKHTFDEAIEDLTPSKQLVVKSWVRASKVYSKSMRADEIEKFKF